MGNIGNFDGILIFGEAHEVAANAGSPLGSDHRYSDIGKNIIHIFLICRILRIDKRLDDGDVRIGVEIIRRIESWLRECRRPESNRHGRNRPRDFKSLASTYSATPALKRGGFRIRTGE